jgi:predicted RNase H-like HicB family nuclease
MLSHLHFAILEALPGRFRGCVATGETLEEIKRLMQEGLEFHLEGMCEDGLPIPEPTTQVPYADVAA